MLQELRIQNFAIIEDLSLSFEQGLNVISGDTGAGKSILIGALGLILGGRGSPDMIRTGAAQARITACFNLEQRPDQSERIRALGMAVAHGELVVHRVLHRTGKAQVTVNGDPVTVGLLARMADSLVDIHGQHEHHSLMDRERHTALLDAFGKTEPLLSRYRKTYEELMKTRDQLLGMENLVRERRQRIDFLQFQVREIDAFDPKPGEDTELEHQLQMLRNAERIGNLAQQAHALLYESEDSISDHAGRLLTVLRELGALDTRTGPWSEQCEEIKYRLEDMANTLRDYASSIESDPESLANTEDRMDGLRKLQRKYGESIQEILSFRDQSREELQELMASQEDLPRVKERFERTLSEAGELATELSRKRTEAAQEMQKHLEKELAQLGMSGTRFLVPIEAHAGGPQGLTDNQGRSLSPTGMDEVEFRVSPNPGEEPRPLVRIASGGELSRMMLAIKTVLADVDSVGTLIFDEVDSGIGGGVAEILGRRLRYVARKRQVICVTHLPQIASQGDSHHHIAKGIRKGRTQVFAARLHQEERVQEIARMLGGIEITDKTVQHAQEMLDSGSRGNERGMTHVQKKGKRLRAGEFGE